MLETSLARYTTGKPVVYFSGYGASKSHTTPERKV